ncbi:dihydroneopterin aldolase [Aliidiomarina sedimenti]|uniref:7,8-dihydroneopterin aldolase n=1 Tax=Aliidiomarina sedimenti TaxID=1933879 RepID=A0ABY0BX52_9GAMM|nr:dihydroneopterin aldolase [Aliidiomarina sedimenti]RUO28980.1 dihydroneopterin aldolase [Aliidiomarina sedimenti]
MTDRVLIEGLRIDATIGIYDWEKKVRQPLLLDIEMAWDNRRPGLSDDIQDALDYEAVSNELTALVQRKPYELIERVAEEAASMVMSTFAVTWLRLKVSKPTALKNAVSVAVQIERGTRD